MAYLEILGTIVGFIYLWLEYKASISIWIVGIIMPAIYIFVYYKAGLYADFGMNIYYLIAALYGYLGWKYGFHKNKNKKTNDLRVTHIPLKYYLPLSLIFLTLWAGIYLLLISITNSTVPFADSFINALSIIALWMLARKYAEQWIPWIVIDALSAALFIYKDLYFTSTLYAVYAIVAIFGYRKWLKMVTKCSNNE